ncbi:hypothetical protein COA17_13740 [Sphingomonas ginsenosidimutans]|jgi:hypothetical protein|uniref:Uncharacterized protein n=1 Tax=Sphingomonas ginsenosidimutans TaxID=862134 RepID=A0A2A4HV68_9SPHN|nr:hypothetical protein [Sphingomonas ginsenosidimutans]MEE2915608.1 hypothetical protein [Pseudomonadota bacterium]PCG08416.1 hypothetical protein COA17_13740 [Sphingomonas ginsenosidimutans]
MIAKIVDWREHQKMPRAADNRVTVLRAILKYGAQRGDLKIDAAEKITKIYINRQKGEDHLDQGGSGDL